MIHEEENDTKRLNYSNFTKERTNDILNFNNEIASLQKNLEVAESTMIGMQHEMDVNVRNTSDKTLELGQILMAVGNLLQRCTSGINGAILKHTETNTNEPISMGSGNVSTESEELDIVSNGKKAMADLDVIAAYMVDFTGIVESRIEGQRAAKKSSISSAIDLHLIY